MATVQTALARPVGWRPTPGRLLGTIAAAASTACVIAMAWTHAIVPLATTELNPAVGDATALARDSLATHMHQAIPVPTRPLPDAQLNLLSVRRDRIDVQPFDSFGYPRPKAFDEVEHFFRSARGSEVPIDPRLVELLMTISRRFEGRQLVLVSGHRDPGSGTSTKSYHVRGMAADIAIAGVPSREVRAAALELGARGVGLYPHFVHIDVRDVPYKWTGR